MISKFKRLWRDRRGNVLAITGAAIPLVVGAAGLATDTIQWVNWKRDLQRSADSAAIAGVMGKAWGASNASAAVNADLAQNHKNGISLMSGYPLVTYPNQAGWASPVRVTLKLRKRLGFSSMFISSAPIITATGTAALVQEGEYCIVALEDGTEPGITISGSSDSTLGCGAISNSIADDDSTSVDTNGNAYNFRATVIAGAGGLPPSIRGTTVLQPHHLPQPDPFADKYNTSVPASGNNTCSSFNSHQTQTQGGQNKIYALTPGCYNDFKITGSDTYNLAPGVYYLNNADFEIQGGATLAGTGVTIILTGTTPKSIKTNGNAKINLVAPVSGSCGTFNGVNTCDFEKMLFIQASNASIDNDNLINGNNTSLWDGKLYFPKGKVTFTGSTGAMTKCAMVVAKKVAFSGNANLQNDVTGCSANGKEKAWVVRLVG